MRETTAEKNRIVYGFAKQFLVAHLPREITAEGLNKYYVGDASDASSLKDVFITFIMSAQDYQQMPNVIQFVNRKDEMAKALYGFDYSVLSSMSEVDIYDALKGRFSVSNAGSKRNSWYKWSCSIVDSARFVAGFTDYDDFVSFVKRFDYNSDTRMALPLLISTRIRGVGFAIACNVLKELGYLEYPKPDIHMIDICEALELSDRDPLNVFQAIIRMAEDNGVSAYEIDKTLWLICSGNFYLDGVKSKSRKIEFIDEVKHEIIEHLGEK